MSKESQLGLLLERLKKDPLFEVRQEFGKFLFKQYELLTPDELKRYNELKSQLLTAENPEKIKGNE